MPNSVEFLDSFLDIELERAVKDVPIAHIGFEGLDQAIGGIRKNDLILVGGMPGCGKSSLVNSIKDYLAKDHPVLLATYEMRTHKYLAKSLSYFSNGALKVNEIAGCEIGHEKRDILEATKEKYRDLARNIACPDDMPTTKRLGTLLRGIRNQRQQTPILLVDYCQRMKFEGDEDCVDPTTRSCVIADQLLDISRDSFPIIAVSAISRSTYTKKNAGVDCLAGTQRQEYNATTIIHLSMEDASDDCQMDLSVPVKKLVTARVIKNRDGDSFTSVLEFTPAFSSFREISFYRGL